MTETATAADTLVGGGEQPNLYIGGKWVAPHST